MKGVIVLNGQEVDDYIFPKDSFIIACDGGYRYLIKRGVIPNVVLGDFDSLEFVPEGAKVFPADKDYTDGELGLIEAKNLGLTEVDFICAGGGRDDQFFANVGLLEKAYMMGIEGRIFTASGQIYYCGNKFSIGGVNGKTVSIYPLEKTEISSSFGLKYDCKGLCLNRGDTLAISNVAICDRVEITVKSGAALIFINK